MKTLQMTSTSSRWTCLPACAAAVLLAGSAFSVDAASIAFLGVEEGIGPAYAPQNWSSPAAPKTFDLGGSEVYGTAGYYQIRPTPIASPSNVGEGVSGGNDLGISASGNPTLYSAPVMLSSVTGGAGTFVNFGGYPTFLGPDGSTIYRQGSLSVAANQGPYNTPSGDGNGYFGEAFAFTMGMSATYRVGITVDTAANGTYAPDYVSIYTGSTGTVYSAQLVRNGTVDMAVFEIDALAGENFTAAVWQLAGTQSVAPFGLITFDVARYNFDVASGQSVTNSVSLGGAPAGLLKAGGGTLVLASSNSCAGGTLVSAGALMLSEGCAIGGSITNNASLVITADMTNVVSGAGSLTKANAGNASLWSANTYTGPTVVEAGQLRLDGAGAISSASAVQIASGASFSATGFYKTSNNLTIAGLTGAGQFYNAAGTLTVNKASASETFSGSIDGATGLTKSGNGTLILSGSNSYTGATSVDGGILRVAKSNFTADVGTAAITMSSVSPAPVVGSTYQLFSGSFTGTRSVVFAGLSGVQGSFTPASSTVTVTSVGGYSAWADYWTTNAGLFDTNGTADPDSDGFVNDVEYAFDGNPTLGTPALMTVTAVGSNAVFNWVQRIDGATYEVQKNSALTNFWTVATGLSISNASNQSGLLLPADYIRREFRVPASGKDFYRVRSTAP
ncbi:MAG: hypothetical protein RIQ71_58 [Verrucomicrobiota bacterium]|jgi:autotransporter-associated beta strand protein